MTKPPPNPKGHTASLGTEPLKENEKSRPIRIRAESWVFEELAGMTAVQVGELVSTALRAKSKPVPSNVLPGTPELFPEVPKEAQKPTRKAPKASKKPTSGNTPTLTPSQAQVVAALRLPDAVAEYDGYEQRWLAGFAGIQVDHADLEHLKGLGVLVVTGEGLAAVYRIRR